MLDEVDKLAATSAATRLGTARDPGPEQNNTSGTILDVRSIVQSAVICTATADTVPPPLLDRMELIFLRL